MQNSKVDMKQDYPKFDKNKHIYVQTCMLEVHDKSGNLIAVRNAGIWCETKYAPTTQNTYKAHKDNT